MRVAVIVAWRPKGHSDWQGRGDRTARDVARPLARDPAVAPYVGIHIASLLPRHWDITLVHECVRDVDLDMDVEAVFISTIDFCAGHARWLAGRFSARGVKVIVGGLYPTLDPGYFQDVADAVVVGEAEPVMPRLIADLQANCLQPCYQADREADLAELPVPRYDLVERDFWVPGSYEITRGCPFACSYCVLSVLRTRLRQRPIPHVLRDLSAVPAGWSWFQRRTTTFWDNNLGADRRYFRELCEALVPLRRYWGTQTSIDTITPESARLLGRAGCRVAYIGLESLSQQSLANTRKRHNKVREYREKLGYLHDNGVLVMSIFLLGLDGDSPEYLRRVPDLIDAVGVDIPVYSFAAPIARTPFRAGLEADGRLLPGDLNHALDGTHLVYRPLTTPADEVESALCAAMMRSYDLRRAAGRVLRRLRDGVGPALFATLANHRYRAYQRAIADTVLRRVRARGPWPGPDAQPPGTQAPRTPLLSLGPPAPT
jgi:radical SAM superfamily enzyme YgiQ (UPF0313 family)